MRNNKIPKYIDKADYNTNSPSYYHDLARKNKLIKLLAERIWEYDEELAKRFEAWDKNLEEFDDEVIRLLQEWIDDGTFAHIINEEIFQLLNEEIRRIEMNPNNFGVVGDGVTDDTQAFQEMLNSPLVNVVRLNEGDKYLITQQLTLPSEISFVGTGEFIFSGESDYWLFAQNYKKVDFEYLKAELINTPSVRTKFNRILRCEYGDILNIDYAEIEGATTAVHNLFGETFTAGTIKVKNVYGWNANDYHEGYGVVSSARHTHIHEIHFENDSNEMGRHAFYMNGDIWQNAIVDYIYVKKCRIFPISIVHSGTNNAILDIKRVQLIDTNHDSSVGSNGSINVSREVNPNLTIKVHRIDSDTTGGVVLSSQGSVESISIDEVNSVNTLIPKHENSSIVNIRFAKNFSINHLNIDSLNNGWLAGLRIRDVPKANISNIYVGGTLGGSAVSLLDSDVIIDGIETDSIERMVSTGSEITYKTPLNFYEYSKTKPTRTAKRSEVVFTSVPNQQGHYGWIGDRDGEWLEFGFISRKPSLNTYGNTNQRPAIDDMRITDTGFRYYDTEIEKPIYWDGVDNVWRDSVGVKISGRPALRTYGSISQRPSIDDMGIADTGYMYYDTEIDKPIYWDGTDNVWRDGTGVEV